MGELILLALITAFVLYKLFSILGNTTEEDVKRSEMKKNMASRCGIFGGCNSSNNTNSTYSENSAPLSKPKPIDAELISSKEEHLSSTLVEKVRHIQTLDNSFTIENFLNGAERAFFIINEAEVKGDTETLENLTTNQIYVKLMANFTQLKNSGKHLVKDIRSVDNIHISDISVSGNMINISVTITNKQIAYVQDNEGNIISGDTHNVLTKIDNWVFVRHMLTDKVWKLSYM